MNYSRCYFDFCLKELTEIRETSKVVVDPDTQSDTKKRELLKNPPKIEEIQEKSLLTVIEPLRLAF